MTNKQLRRNRLVMLGIFILSLVAISLRGGAVSYGLFALCLIIPLLSFAYLIYVYASFKIYQEVGQKTITKGEAVPYRFVLTNEFFLVYTHVNVSFYTETSTIEQAPEEERYTLLFGDSVRYETMLTGSFRGEYLAGINEVTVIDYLGLFRLRYRLVSPMKINVLPRVPELSNPRRIASVLQRMEQDMAFLREEPDIPVREYRSGDPLKRIHWKASAKTGAWKVRTTTGFDALPVYLYLDLCAVGIENVTTAQEWIKALKEEDTRIECTLALAKYFAEGRTPYTLYVSDEPRRGLRVQAPGQFNGVYERVSKVQFGPGEVHGPWEMPENTMGIWITGKIEADWMEQVFAHARPEENLLILSVSEAVYACQHPRIQVLNIMPGAKPEEVL